MASQYVHVAVLLRQAVGQGFPFSAASAATIHAQFTFEREMFGIALDRDDINSFRFVGMHVDGEAEISGQVAADFLPGIAGIVAAHDVPCSGMRSDAKVHRMPGRSGRRALGSGMSDRRPWLIGSARAAIVGAERARTEIAMYMRSGSGSSRIVCNTCRRRGRQRNRSRGSSPKAPAI